MVHPKINCFSELEPFAELENACTWCVQLIQEPSFFTSSQMFCFVFFHSQVLCSEKDAKQNLKTLNKPVLGLRVLSPLALQKLNFL